MGFSQTGSLQRIMRKIPFGDSDRDEIDAFGKQAAEYLDTHPDLLDIDTEGQDALKVLKGILDGEIAATPEEIKLVTMLIGKLVPGAATRSAEVKREDPGIYIARAMAANETSFKKLTKQAEVWALEASRKTMAVMEELSGGIE